MRGHIRRPIKRQKITRVWNESYCGSTDAHQVLAHVMEAGQALALLVVTNAPREQKVCLHHLAQAFLWLRTAVLTDLDPATRWNANTYLCSAEDVIDRWMLAQAAQERPTDQGSVALDALSTISRDLWGWGDHLDRLLEQRRISRLHALRLKRKDIEYRGPQSETELQAQLTALWAIVERWPVDDGHDGRAG